MAQATRKRPVAKTEDAAVSARIDAQSHFRTLRLGTPFQPRLDALAKTQDWYNWAGYRAPHSLWDEELEYFAIRSQAALFDISPMTKYRIEGPDAEAFLDRVTLRDVTKLKPGRVHYTAWCDDEGFVLDDGTLFRISPIRFRLCSQERHLPWLLEDKTFVVAPRRVMDAAGPELGDIAQRDTIEEGLGIRPFDPVFDHRRNVEQRRLTADDEIFEFLVPQ